MISDATHPVGSVNPDGVPVVFQAPVTDRATAIALFNVLNHPTLGNPNGSMNANGGLISGPKFFQNNTPDARFFQLALKYWF